MAGRDLIRPPVLRPGDTIAVVSLSWGGPAVLKARFEQGKRQLAETFGLRVIESPHCSAEPAWLRDHPAERAADLHWALENPAVDGIISSIGGDDSIRLVPYLDLGLIRRHPKVFTGYSDTTVQHLVHRLAGVGSFYGMAVLSTAAEAGGIHPYAAESFRATVMSTEPVGPLAAAPEWTEEHLDWRDEQNLVTSRRWVPNYGWLWLGAAADRPVTTRGYPPPVTGPLIGGCLEILALCLGTPIFPELEAFEGAVLHLEISEERPGIDQVRLWLRGFAAAGIIERIAALMFSRPENYSLQDTLSLYRQIEVELREAGRPDLSFVANLDFGHSSPMGLLPLGRQVRLDPRARTIEVVEAAVVP